MFEEGAEIVLGEGISEIIGTVTHSNYAVTTIVTHVGGQAITAPSCSFRRA